MTPDMQQQAVSPSTRLSDTEGGSSVYGLESGQHSYLSPIKVMTLKWLYLNFNFEQMGGEVVS
jgi:hypothetical protein